MIFHKTIAIAACLLSMPSIKAMQVPPSLKAQSLKVCADYSCQQIKQKINRLPTDLYVNLAQEIILNNSKLSIGQLIDILSHMKTLLHQTILKPSPLDTIIIDLFIAAIINDKQEIKKLLEKVPITVYLTTAFALIFKNETMPIADKSEILNQMLVNSEFKKTKDAEIISFFANFLKSNHEYLSGKKHIMIEQTTNTVIDLRDSGEGAITLLQEALIARNAPVIHFLLKHHANPNLSFDDSLLPISYAAEYGLNDIIMDLIAHGAQLQPETHKRTPYYDPLLRSAQNGHETTVILLLKKGAEINKIFHTWDWGYGTLLDQIHGMKKINANNHDLDQAAALLRKYGAVTLDEIPKQKK